MAVNYLGDNSPSGACLGTGTSEKIAFHGSTPVVQQTVTAVATGATAATIVTSLQALQDALNTLGLISSS